MSSGKQGGLVLSIREGGAVVVVAPGGEEIEVKVCSVSPGANGGQRCVRLRIVAPGDFGIERKEPAITGRPIATT